MSSHPDEESVAGPSSTAGATLASLVLFLLALAFIGSFPASTWFTLDQTRDVESGREILAGDFPTLGPVIGQTPLRLGPLYFYLCALALGVRDAPVDIVLLFALLNALAVPLWVAGVRRFVAMRTALWSGAALAVSPFLLCFGSALWNPALIVPCLALATYGFGRWFERRSIGASVLLSVGLVGLSQVHVTCGLVILLFVAGVVCRPGGIRAGLAVLAILVAANALPIIENVRLLVSTPWAEMTKTVPAGPRTSFFLSSLRALTIERVAIHHNPPPAAVWRLAFDVAAYAWAALAVAGGIAALRARSAPALRWVFAFVVAYPIAILLLPTPAYVYYFLPVVPGRALLVAHLLTTLAPPARRPVGIVAVAAAATMAAVHWANDLRTDRTGLLRGSTTGLDLTARAGGDRLNITASLAAKRALGRALAFDRASLEASLRGPWKHVLTEDGGFWLRPTAARATPMLILHGEDGIPPPPEDRLRSRVAGGFAIYDLPDRATAVRATVKGHGEDVVLEAPDLLDMRDAVRPWPPCRAVVFDVALDSNEASDARPSRLCVTSWFDAEPVAAAVGALSLAREAIAPREGLRVVVFEGIPSGARSLRLTVRPPPTVAPRPIAIDLALYPTPDGGGGRDQGR